MDDKVVKAAKAVVAAYAQKGVVSEKAIRNLQVALEGVASAPKKERSKARAFETEYFAACMAAKAVHGVRWYLDCPGVVWGDVPSGLRNYAFVDKNGRKIKGPRDRHIPPARFWPGGKIPESIVLAEPISKER